VTLDDDPVQAPAAFVQVLAWAGVPVELDVAWRLAPVERARVLKRHRRELLVMAAPGRRRLRAWLDQRRGQPVESQAERRRRVTRDVWFVGDPELWDTVVETIASLPAPVVDAVLTEAVVVASGRSSNGWLAGALPAGRRVLALAGHRDDADLARTLRHEVGHLWTTDQSEASSEQHQARALAEMVDQIATHTNRPSAERFQRGLWLVAERQANALRTAWEPEP